MRESVEATALAIRMTASFQVRPETLDESLAAIAEFVAHVGANEPGTSHYVSWQDSEDPTRFIHHMAFDNDEARSAHSESDGVKRFTEVLYPNLIAPVEFRTYGEVASASG